MIETGKEYDRLEEALVYSDIYKQQNRKGCAIIPWLGIEKAIAEYEKAKYLHVGSPWHSLHGMYGEF